MSIQTSFKSNDFPYNVKLGFSFHTPDARYSQFCDSGQWKRPGDILSKNPERARARARELRACRILREILTLPAVALYSRRNNERKQVATFWRIRALVFPQLARRD